MARASYILSRTLFVDDRKNRVRFSEFCMVNTPLGAMMECRQPSVSMDGPVRQVNADETFTRVDLLSPFDSRDPSAIWNRLQDVNRFPMTQGYGAD